MTPEDGTQPNGGLRYANGLADLYPYTRIFYLDIRETSWWPGRLVRAVGIIR